MRKNWCQRLLNPPDLQRQLFKLAECSRWFGLVVDPVLQGRIEFASRRRNGEVHGEIACRKRLQKGAIIRSCSHDIGHGLTHCHSNAGLPVSLPCSRNRSIGTEHDPRIPNLAPNHDGQPMHTSQMYRHPGASRDPASSYQTIHSNKLRHRGFTGSMNSNFQDLLHALMALSRSLADCIAFSRSYDFPSTLAA